MQLKEKVRFVLKKYPETRNCDLVLTKMVWLEWYREFLVGEALPLRNLKLVAREDHISRIRRKIQEYGEFLPTIESVVDKEG